MRKIISLFQRCTRLDSGCLEWRGGKTSAGYASIRWNGRTDYGHRIIYQELKGHIPNGAVIDHLCRNRGCLEIAHLAVTSRGENVLRGVSPPAINARKTICPQGHPYDEQNTCVSDGKRYCRPCARNKMRNRRLVNA